MVIVSETRKEKARPLNVAKGTGALDVVAWLYGSPD
jgi:hypothetical protein